MSDATRLVPLSTALSNETAIVTILSAIPLLCEGVMGLGIFSFYFFTQQATLVSCFLCGSAFLSFAAGIIDLSQITLRTQATANRGPSLTIVSDLLNAREVFLVVSLVSLNIALWLFVSERPLGEEPTLAANANIETQEDDRASTYSHTASWSRWGLVGMILQWVCLASIIAIGLMQFLWRLLPDQRNFSNLYVADCTVQATLTAIFILKLFLNIYISSFPSRWQPLKHYLAPLGALLIGVGISVGTLMIYGFADMPLGRFLRGTQVYILLVYNLHNTFHRTLSSKKRRIATPPPSPTIMRKEKGELLPISTFNLTRTRTPSVSAMFTERVISRSPVVMDSPRMVSQVVDTEYNSPATVRGNIFIDIRRPARTSRLYIPPNPTLPPPTAPGSSEKIAQPAASRPVTGVSTLSYYMNEVPVTPPPAMVASSAYSTSSSVSDQEGTRWDKVTVLSSQSSSRQSSMDVDEILRRQTALDESIAALRIVSPPAATPDVGAEPAGASKSLNDSYRSTKTQSLDARSDFSLSIFPDPPVAPATQVASKYSVDYSINGPVNSSVTTLKTTSGMPSSEALGLEDRRMPASNPTGYDVTSFIGGLTVPADAQSITSTIEDQRSDITTAEPGTIVTAVRSSTTGMLRPMLLSSSTLTSATPMATIPASPPSRGGPFDLPSSLPSPPEVVNGPILRPLLIGRPPSLLPQRIHGSSSVVPLAQRRKRGGSGTLQRPTISRPMNRSLDMADPLLSAAFERPRPPPLRLIVE